jgi:hypothetical protein
MGDVKKGGNRGIFPRWENFAEFRFRMTYLSTRYLIFDQGIRNVSEELCVENMDRFSMGIHG